MPRVTLEQVSIGEEKMSKNGKPYRTAGIKVDGKWYNGFANQDVMKWKAGDTVTVEFFQQEWQGKAYDKFKCPSRLDMLEERVAKLESILSRSGVSQSDVQEKAVTDPTITTITPETEDPAPDLPF